MTHYIKWIELIPSKHFTPKQQNIHSSAYEIFSRIDHILGHKTSLNKFKQIEITSSIFSDHSAMKPEINHKKKTEKYTKIWKLNNMLLNNEWVNKKIKEEIKTYLEINENEDTTIQNLGHWESNPKKEIHSITGLFKEKKCK